MAIFFPIFKLPYINLSIFKMISPFIIFIFIIYKFSIIFYFTIFIKIASSPTFFSFYKITFIIISIWIIKCSFPVIFIIQKISFIFNPAIFIIVNPQPVFFVIFEKINYFFYENSRIFLNFFISCFMYC